MKITQETRSLFTITKENISRMQKECTNEKTSPLFKNMILVSLQDGIHHLNNNIVADQQLLLQPLSPQERYFIQKELNEKQLVLNEWREFEKKLIL